MQSNSSKPKNISDIAAPRQAQAPIAAQKKPSKTGTHKPSRRTMIIIVGVVLVLALLVGGYFVYKSQTSAAAKQRRNIQESERVIRKVKRRLFTDSAETPTVARVVNPDELKASNQTFYKNVQVGDYVIIYNGRAIIYRDRYDQIINVAPIIKNVPQTNSE